VRLRFDSAVGNDVVVDAAVFGVLAIYADEPSPDIPEIFTGFSFVRTSRTMCFGRNAVSRISIGWEPPNLRTRLVTLRCECSEPRRAAEWFNL
jgi:hypothetical protein